METQEAAAAQVAEARTEDEDGAVVSVKEQTSGAIKEVTAEVTFGRSHKVKLVLPPIKGYLECVLVLCDAETQLLLYPLRFPEYVILKGFVRYQHVSYPRAQANDESNQFFTHGVVRHALRDSLVLELDGREGESAQVSIRYE